MNRYIMKCPHCGYECETGEMLPLKIMELNDVLIDCGNCGKEIKITHGCFSYIWRMKENILFSTKDQFVSFMDENIQKAIESGEFEDAGHAREVLERFKELGSKMFEK